MAKLMGGGSGFNYQELLKALNAAQNGSQPEHSPAWFPTAPSTPVPSMQEQVSMLYGDDPYTISQVNPGYYEMYPAAGRPADPIVEDVVTEAPGAEGGVFEDPPPNGVSGTLDLAAGELTPEQIASIEQVAQTYGLI